MPFPNEDTQFEKGQTGNPNGRPRKWVCTLKADGYRKSEINDTLEVMLSMTLEELKGVFDNPDATILEKTIANALRKSLSKGSLYSIETLITRVHGAPKQQIEQDILMRTEQPFFQDVPKNDGG